MCIVGIIAHFRQNLMYTLLVVVLIIPTAHLIISFSYLSFQEYEENSTPESKFVKDLDRLDMVLQAFEYEKRDNCPKKHQEFFDSTDGKFNHPLVCDLVQEIKTQRNAAASTSDAAQSSSSSS